VRRPGIYPLLWGLLLVLSSVPVWGWSFGLPGGGRGCSSATCVVHPVLAPALLSGAGLVSIAIGAVLLLRRADGMDSRSRPVVDQSLTTAVVVLGIMMAALGGAVGRWLTWIGAGVVLFGLAGMIRESIALRKLRRGAGER
jgi:hypothetical protein